MTQVDRLRIVFLGTPEFAVPTLKALIDHPNLDVVAVVTQPDRPKGRGQKTQAPATKQLALLHDILILQPDSLAKSSETVETLRILQPDLIVMVAFGQILKKAVLNLPRFGVINLHASLLPAYRGAAPINWAIINGERETGITTMFTDSGVDTGPMLLKKFLPISANIDAEELAKQMSTEGAQLVLETLEKLKSDTLTPEKQDDTKATYAPILTKELSKINWRKSAFSIHNLVRGLIPWPGTFTLFRGEPLKIWKTSIECSTEPEFSQKAHASDNSGMIYIAGKTVLVRCGADGADTLQLIAVQPVNRARISALDWLNGCHFVNNEGFDV